MSLHILDYNNVAQVHGFGRAGEICSIGTAFKFEADEHIERSEDEEANYGGEINSGCL